MSGLAGALALAASLAGLLIDGVYTGAASTAEMLRGYDLATAAATSHPASPSPPAAPDAARCRHSWSPPA